MARVPPIQIEEILSAADREPWKQKRDREDPLKRQLCGLRRSEWLKLREVVISNRDLIQNANSRADAAQRVKRDARLCCADWITLEHIELAIELVG